MATITKKQLTTINSKCYNGWRLDVQYYLGYGEKTFIKQIDVDDENYLEFAIRYNSNNQIELHISKYFHKKDEPCAVTSGLGKNIMLDEIPLKRKDTNNLIAFTKTLTDEKLLELKDQAKLTESYGMFLKSEDF